MTLATATPPVVRERVRKLRTKNDQARIMGIHAQPVWHHDSSMTVDGSAVRVRACISPLAVREALVEHQLADDDGYLVVLTDCTHDDLGTGILAHLAYSRLVPVDLWDTVQESFRAAKVDSTFVERDKSWAPGALVGWEPAAGWPDAPGATLTRDFALGQLAGAVLGVDGTHIDAAALLRWSSDAVAVRRFMELPAEVRDGLSGWLVERTGPAGTLTLRAAVAGFAADAAALALVAELLWHPEVDPAAVGVGRGMFASRVGGQLPPDHEARAWGRVAKVLVAGELADELPQARQIVERAEQLLEEFHCQAVAPLSRFLQSALDGRLRALASAVGAAVPAPKTPALSAIEAALHDLHDHEMGAADPRVGIATMAVRLVRWLAASPPVATPPDGVDTLAAALDRQVRVDAWVDRAYADIFTGDQDQLVAASYAAVAAVVAARRAVHDEQLAFLLAEATAADAALGRIIPVEEALARVVRPLASGERGVLLILIDGMSTAVATEITEGIAARRWTELVDGTLSARQALLPPLPTLTGVSRTSLLTGRLLYGTATDEKRHFADAVGVPARLFHKDDLQAPAGAALAPDVATAIADPALLVVGVVLNTVDDTLHHVDPGGTSWNTDNVQYLAALLDAARTADRILVVTSDHGHVIERGSTLVPSTSGSPRWRPASMQLVHGEIALSGRRVLREGGSVVLPWREDIRYARKYAGYHGGASAAEVTIPITVHVRGLVDSIAGWVPAPPPEPPWWHSPLSPAEPTVMRAPAVARPAESAPTLFDEHPDADPYVVPADADLMVGLLDALLTSEVYALQRRRAERAALDDERVRSLLMALLRNNGRLHETTLAGVAQVPVARMRTVLAAVRKLLNVEGYDVLSLDADQVTVVLDVALLREQFHLGRSR